MARITKPLTNTEVKQAKAKEKVYNLSDGGGLALRVRPNGSKLWLLDYYRPYTKKRTSLSFGTYPEVSLADARREREKARELLAKDIDPKEHRDQKQQILKEAHQNTFQNIASMWFEVKKADVTPDYAEDIWRSLELHIFPTLGPLPVHKVAAPKAIEVIRPIAAKGSLETVKRLCQRMNEIMIYAVNTGLIESNPLAGIKKAFEAPKKKNMATIKPEQLPELMKALSTASIKKTTRGLIEWQLHTMTRPSEAAGTRWNEFDFAACLWNIPAERMKKKKDHTVPLSPQALSLLEAMKPISGHREHVFPADRDPTRHTNEQTANAALKRMGFSGILVAHGLRALASTTLNEQGFDPDVIEAALAHIDKNEVRRAYNRADYLERRKALMYWWSEYIETAATGSMSLAAGNHQGLRAINS
ncbi:integrase domain-containing protein [Photobacterium lipolyticum]|uniref:Integrase n=1 Tax=Photobacterium lipolyticum TaxID=266810 RepID=A0A2T3MTM5_9GAMM|nr:integrase domain-containing protein [Photobacterium lipolyticum]PSW02556.1 integrase [Photobacterium lipolyticum]